MTSAMAVPSRKENHAPLPAEPAMAAGPKAMTALGAMFATLCAPTSKGLMLRGASPPPWSVEDDRAGATGLAHAARSRRRSAGHQELAQRPAGVEVLERCGCLIKGTPGGHHGLKVRVCPSMNRSTSMGMSR